MLNSVETEKKISEILSKMTLSEKIGQLNLVGRSPVGGVEVTIAEKREMLEKGMITVEEFENDMETQILDGQEDDIACGKIGGFLGITDPVLVNHLQKIAVEKSRTGIPLIMGQDVIHGLWTVFPIPLAESCSFDDELFELTAVAAAEEAWAHGVDWTYAPMIDVARDARWGRIAEGAGEDTYLASHAAAAKVRGFQGTDMSQKGKIAACAKHYVAYGACEGGMDYNSVDMSFQKLWNVYLPPFKAAVDAGAATVMTAFNDLNGTPCTANKYLLKKVLKENFNFDGMVVSDSMSVQECVAHGYALDRKDAARKCLDAGLDMDMHSKCYIDYLCELVNEGVISEEQINDAVRRVLRLKFRLGLFENPYREIKLQYDSSKNRCLARRSARESIVLLKNEGVLPLKPTCRIAVVGELADNAKEMIGCWASEKSAENPISLNEGLKKRTDCRFYADVDEAIKNSNNFDFVIAAVGEIRTQSGEASSRSFIGLSDSDNKMLVEIKKLGKPLITVLFNGRPLAIPDAVEISDAVIEAWHLGCEAGNAISDILFGDYNPSGRLSTSFPNTSGQTPSYYNHLSTGKPASDFRFSAHYLDTSYKPLFPFGFGLSYTTYEYKDLSAKILEDFVNFSVTVKNTGTVAGTETVQLYVQDIIGSIVRPVKELKGYKRVDLLPGQEKIVEIAVKKSELGFFSNELEYVTESGEFRAWMCHDSSCEEFIVFKI